MHFLRVPTSSVAVFGLLLSFSYGALASPDYPETVRAHLDLSCTPKCRTCHESDVGRSGNAKQPFAQSLIELGLEGGDATLLPPALDALNQAGTDSDGDEVADVEELQAKEPRDPSVAGVGDVCSPEVHYGCGAQITPRLPHPGWFVPLSLLVVFGPLLRRRRRRS